MSKKSKKQYRPYTWEERKHLRGKWIKWTNMNNEEIEFQIVNMKLDSNDGFVINDGITPEILLSMAEFVDGSPCGVEVKE